MPLATVSEPAKSWTVTSSCSSGRVRRWEMKDWSMSSGSSGTFFSLLEEENGEEDWEERARRRSMMEVLWPMIAPNPALSPALESSKLNSHLRSSVKKKWWWLLRRYIQGKVASLILNTSFMSLSLAM